MLPKEIDINTIKNELDIYWNSEQTEGKIERYIAEGKSLLCDYAGANIVFQEGSAEGRLLVSYVLYAYNKKSEFFETNYQSDLIRLRLKYQGGINGED